jgi:hypothetical protein
MNPLTGPLTIKANTGGVEFNDKGIRARSSVVRVGDSQLATAIEADQTNRKSAGVRPAARAPQLEGEVSL